MPLVPAKCTQCDANIEIDRTKEAGICPYCGTAFVTEKAINNYNIQNATIITPGKNLDNLKKLGNDEYRNRNYSSAYDYYGEVLEINASDYECIFMRELINIRNSLDKNVGTFNDGLPYLYFEKILKAFYGEIEKESELNDEFRYEKIEFACNECYNIISSWYYSARNRCITAEKMIDDSSYRKFLQFCKESAWAIIHILEFEDSISQKYSGIEELMLKQCDFALKVLDDQTKKYGASNNKYGCYTLKGTLADQCYQNAEKIAKFKCKLDSSYYLPDNLNASKMKEKVTGLNGCYIATCIYGSYDCPQVWTLRRFRGYTLHINWYGRLFIKCYYATSPALVKWFGGTAWFKMFWKSKLDRLVAKLNSNGIEDTKYIDKYY